MGVSTARGGPPLVNAAECAAVFVNRHMEDAEIHACGAYEAAVYSARSPERDGANEDSAALFCLNGAAAVFVVADGMGGMPNAERASAALVESFAQALHGAPALEGYREPILNGIEQANRAIAALGAGSTLAVAEIVAGCLRTYHVGDAALLVTGQRGRIKLQTVAHSPVGYGVEAGLLDAREAMHHEDRHLLLNMLGSPDMRVEMGSLRALARYDTVLLASDGLFDNLGIDEIAAAIRTGPLSAAMDRLAAAARARMTAPEPGHPSKPDDLTFILVRRRG